MTLRRILALLALVPLVFTVCIAEEGAGETERNLPEEPPPPEKEKECPCDDEPKNRCVYTKISLGATSGEHEKFNVNSLRDSIGDIWTSSAFMELALMLTKVGGLRKGCILMLIACALCSACVQSRSRVVIGGNKCVKVFGAKLPELNGGSRNNDHRVSLVVSDVALANDVYNVFSLLARNGAWEHVRLMLNDNDGIGIYYGTREDYKPLIEYPNNIGVQFKLKNGRKSLIVCRGASEREYLESNVRWLYDEFGRMGESWSMEVCCNRDYPFRDIIKIGRIAANNGCRLLYFTVRPD